MEMNKPENTPEVELDERDLVADQGNAAVFGTDLYSDESGTSPESAPVSDDEPEGPVVALPPHRQTEIKTIPQRGKKSESPKLTETLQTEEAQMVLRETALMMHVEQRNARQEAATSLARYNTALKLHHILSSTIAGVECVGDEVFWVCYEDNLTIRIPVKESFMVVPNDLLRNKNIDTLKRQMQFLGKAIGASIDYVLTAYSADPDSNTDIFYASRVQALKRQRKNFFGKDARFQLKAGMDLYAQILCLGPHAAYITCCGMDIRMANYQLSHRYIQDVSSAYSVGQMIRVRVVEIANPNAAFPSLRVSGRLCELDYLRPNLKRLNFKPNQRLSVLPRFMATVTSLTREKDGVNPGVVISLFLDGIELPAFSRTLNMDIQDMLHTGDKVYFECHGYTPAGYVHGSIVRFIRSR